MDPVTRRISNVDFKEAEYQRNVFVITPEAGTTLDDIKRPEYWSHVARQMRPYDRVEVRGAEGSFYAELLVRVVEPFAATVHVLSHVDFEKKATGEPAVETPEGFELVSRGRNGFAVKRLSDGEIVHQGAPSKAAAVLWVEQHLRKIAA